MRTNNPPLSPPRRGLRKSKEYQFPSREPIKGCVIGLLFLFCFCQSHLSFSQDEENWRTIPSVTEWLEEINNWPDSVYRQDYLRITFNYEVDSGLIATSFEELEKIALNTQRFEINKKIVIFHLDFVGPMVNFYHGRWLTNVHFKEQFSFYRTKDLRLGFKNCVFDKLVEPRLSESRFWLRFEDCHFKDRVNVNNPINPTHMRFLRCSADSLVVFTSIEGTPSLDVINSDFFGLMVINKMNEVLIDSSRFEFGIQFSNVDVNRSFRLVQSNYGGLDLSGANLPQINTYLPFSEASSKLRVDLFNFDYVIFRSNKISDAYYGLSEEELMDKENFDELVANYYKLLGVYRARGEMESYNACYIEMRDKVTARSQLLYEQDPSFNRYFDYQINRFTRAFSDYGTRPAKAIVIFFQVVLAFSIFYFFFPSTWNTTNSEKLMKRLSHLGGYFTSEEGLSDLFEKETKDRYMSYNEFRDFMSSREKELPFYFQTLSKPLYRITTARFSWTRSLLGKTEILNGKWSELPKGRKVLTSMIIGFYLCIYLIWILIVRILNAIALSLNAFSTLGFGEIPTRGVARYITILQGFVGWFLLSIFLVSLIGQILN